MSFCAPCGSCCDATANGSDSSGVNDASVDSSVKGNRCTSSSNSSSSISCSSSTSSGIRSGSSNSGCSYRWPLLATARSSTRCPSRVSMPADDVASASNRLSRSRTCSRRHSRRHSLSRRSQFHLQLQR